MRYTLLIPVCLVSCAKVPVDQAFSPYVERFEAVTGAFNDTPISFGNVVRPAIGTCTRYNDGYKYVTINRSFWDRATDDQKEYLIFHELGHCVLNISHNDKTNNGCPVSIMTKYEFGDTDCYRFNKAYYFNELKSHFKPFPFSLKVSEVDHQDIDSE